jgi:hypothetical protein
MYRTGDVGRWRADGQLEVSGRIDRQLKVNGFRVDPGEIERELAGHGDIARVAVTASGSGPDGPRLAARYTLRHPDRPGPSAASLRRFLHARLPGYMVPAEFVALGQSPAPAPRAAADEILTPVQAGLSHLWSRLLRRERVGLDDDFFALGGNSLLAAEMLAHARVMFGIGADWVRPLTRGLGTAGMTARRAGPISPRRRESAMGMGEPTPFGAKRTVPGAGPAAAPRPAAHPGRPVSRRAPARRHRRAGLVPGPGGRRRARPAAHRRSRRPLRAPRAARRPRRAAARRPHPAPAWPVPREVIRLAGLVRGIPVHYVSSTAVLAGLGAAGVRYVTEDTPLAHPGRLRIGYVETKYVAEELLRNAGRAGLPVTIYRPLDITGSLRTGACHTATEMCALIRFVTDTGLAPDIALPLDFVPADVCAAAIRHISLSGSRGSPGSGGGTYHLGSPGPRSSVTWPGGCGRTGSASSRCRSGPG